LTAGGGPGKELTDYLTQGRPVLTIDCLGTGESLRDGQPLERAKGIGDFATYNLTDAACRVQDILLAETWLAGRCGAPPEIVGLAGMGGEALLAHGLAERSCRTQADLSGLDFGGDRAFVDRLNIPNLRRAGDFVTAIMLGGDRPAVWSGCVDAVMQARLEQARQSAIGNNH
jgi:hypothetical protein